jgi:hypothetical protein
MAHCFWDTHFFSCLLNCQTTIWTDDFPNVCNIIVSFRRWWPSSTEVRPSLKRFHHSYVWVLHMASSPNAIFNISNVSVTAFPIFTQNFTQILCSWKTLIFLSRENRQTRRTCDHIKKHSTMTKQDRAMWFWRRSSSNSLLASSTCRAPLGRRNGGLFWTFGNFPDSSCRQSRGTADS